jgi:CubicO group peptidase (beta-lactamase class C family)
VVVQERIFAPLGMVDTSFVVEEAKRSRFCSLCLQRESNAQSPAPARPAC